MAYIDIEIDKLIRSIENVVTGDSQRMAIEEKQALELVNRYFNNKKIE